MGFFSCTSKFILFFFNLIVVLLSLGVLGIGIYGYISIKNLGGAYTAPPISLMVLGSLVTILAFLGCWGAIQENRCYLHMYGSILLILLLILIGIGAWVMVKKGDAEHFVRTFIDQTFDNAAEDDSNAMKLMNEIQSTFHCCGTYGPLYWITKRKPLLLESCKRSDVGYYTDGCEDKFLGFMRTNLKLMGIFAIVVGCTELIGVVLAFILSSSIKRQILRGHV